jgi:hypothetical protein
VIVLAEVWKFFARRRPEKTAAAAQAAERVPERPTRTVTSGG